MYREPGFLSGCPNWVPRPLTCKKVLLPPFWSKGDTLARGEGMGGPDSDDGTDTLHGTIDILYYNIILLRIAPNICKKIFTKSLGTAFR
jgi:hypothetical protein